MDTIDVPEGGGVDFKENLVICVLLNHTLSSLAYDVSCSAEQTPTNVRGRQNKPQVDVF